MPLLTVEEAAEIMEVSAATVRRWCADGKVRAEKIGRAWAVYPPTDPEPAAAQPIEDYVWCLDCGAPHALFDDELHLLGEDLESLACQEPTRVETLPPDWERTYEAFQITHYSEGSRRSVSSGYDLYEKSPKADPSTHRPMYYLEASDGP